MAASSGIITDLRQGQVPEDMDRLENIQSLLNGIKEFTEEAVTNGDPADIGTYLQTVSLLTDQDREKPEEKDRVTLMTIHSAKGLEFKYVYIVGLEENLFPSSMNNFSPKELEEERRLFYVALTRACNRVTLSYSLNRYKWGSLEHSSPSRFINEIDKTFLDYPQTGGKPFGQAGRQNDQSFREREPGFDRIPSARNLKPVAGSARVISPSPSGPVQYDLLPGDSVTHERFGEGIVDSIEGEAPNTTAVIDFKGVGSKKLLLRFAKLTKRGSSK